MQYKKAQIFRTETRSTRDYAGIKLYFNTIFIKKNNLREKIDVNYKSLDKINLVFLTNI